MSVGVVRWVECTVTEPSYFKLSIEHCPIHLAMLDEVVTCHSLLHPKVLELLVRLFESKQDELEILVQVCVLLFFFNLLTKICFLTMFVFSSKWGKWFWIEWLIYYVQVMSFRLWNILNNAGKKVILIYRWYDISWRRYSIYFCDKLWIEPFFLGFNWNQFF